MNLPKTRRVGYIQMSLEQLSALFNGTLKIPLEYKPVTVCKIYESEGTRFTDKLYRVILASEEFFVAINDGEMIEYPIEWEEK